MKNLLNLSLSFILIITSFPLSAFAQGKLKADFKGQKPEPQKFVNTTFNVQRDNTNIAAVLNKKIYEKQSEKFDVMLVTEDIIALVSNEARTSEEQFALDTIADNYGKKFYDIMTGQTSALPETRYLAISISIPLLYWHSAGLAPALREEIKKYYVEEYKKCIGDNNLCKVEIAAASLLFVNSADQSLINNLELSSLLYSIGKDTNEKLYFAQYALPVLAKNKANIKWVIAKLSSENKEKIHLEKAEVNPFVLIDAVDAAYGGIRDASSHEKGFISGLGEKILSDSPFKEYISPKIPAAFKDIYKPSYLNGFSTEIVGVNSSLDVKRQELLSLSVRMYKEFYSSPADWNDSMRYLLNLKLPSNIELMAHREIALAQLALAAPQNIENKEALFSYFASRVNNAYFILDYNIDLSPEQKASLKNELGAAYIALVGKTASEASVKSDSGFISTIKGGRNEEDIESFWGSLFNFKERPAEAFTNLSLVGLCLKGIVKNGDKIAAKVAVLFKSSSKFVLNVPSMIARTSAQYKAIKYLASKNSMNTAQYAVKNAAYRAAAKKASKAGINTVEGVAAKDFFAKSNYNSAVHGKDIQRIAKDIKQASSVGVTDLGKGGSVKSFVAKDSYQNGFRDYVKDLLNKQYLKNIQSAGNTQKAVVISTDAGASSAAKAVAQNTAPYELPRSYMYSNTNKKALSFAQSEGFATKYLFEDNIYKFLKNKGIHFYDTSTGKLFGYNLSFHPQGFLQSSGRIGGVSSAYAAGVNPSISTAGGRALSVLSAPVSAVSSSAAAEFSFRATTEYLNPFRKVSLYSANIAASSAYDAGGYDFGKMIFEEQVKGVLAKVSKRSAPAVAAGVIFPLPNFILARLIRDDSGLSKNTAKEVYESLMISYGQVASVYAQKSDWHKAAVKDGRALKDPFFLDMLAEECVQGMITAKKVPDDKKEKIIRILKTALFEGSLDNKMYMTLLSELSKDFKIAQKCTNKKDMEGRLRSILERLSSLENKISSEPNSAEIYNALGEKFPKLMQEVITAARGLQVGLAKDPEMLSSTSDSYGFDRDLSLVKPVPAEISKKEANAGVESINKEHNGNVGNPEGGKKASKQTPVDVLEKLKAFIKEKGYFPWISSKDEYESKLAKSARSALDRPPPKDPKQQAAVDEIKRIYEENKENIGNPEERKNKTAVETEALLDVFIEEKGHFPWEFSKDEYEAYLAKSVRRHVRHPHEDPRQQAAADRMKRKKEENKDNIGNPEERKNAVKQTAVEVVELFKAFIKEKGYYPSGASKDKYESTLYYKGQSVLKSKKKDPLHLAAKAELKIIKEENRHNMGSPAERKHKSAVERFAEVKDFIKKTGSFPSQYSQDGYSLYRFCDRLIRTGDINDPAIKEIIELKIKHQDKARYKTAIECLNFLKGSLAAQNPSYPESVVFRQSVSFILEGAAKLPNGKYKDADIQKLYELNILALEASTGKPAWTMTTEEIQAADNIAAEETAAESISAETAAPERKKRPRIQKQEVANLYKQQSPAEAELLGNLTKNYEQKIKDIPNWVKKAIDQRVVMGQGAVSALHKTATLAGSDFISDQDRTILSEFVRKIESWPDLGKDENGVFYAIKYEGGQVLDINKFYLCGEYSGLHKSRADNLPQSANIKLKENDGMIEEVVLSENVQPDEVYALIKALKGSKNTIRMGAHELGITKSGSAKAREGQLHIHIETPDILGENNTLLSYTVNIDVSSLVAGKNDQQILKIYRNFFGSFLSIEDKGIIYL